MIVKYIRELLLDHECVIVPEFGAFITQETPATLDYVTHLLTPPSKEIVFNGKLITDDGVLINYIADCKGISTTESMKIVHDFAIRSIGVLEASGTLRLDGMGVITRINEKDYDFQLDGNMNLFGDSFGLSTIKVQPIYRKETYQHLAEKIATEQKTKTTLMTLVDEQEERPHHVNRYNYKWFRAAAYSMIVATVLVFLGWSADKSDSRLASWNPFFYSSPNEFIASHLKTEPVVETPEPIVETVEPVVEVVEPVIEPVVEPVVIQPVDDTYYYIIGASLRSDADAQKCVSKFKKAGFSNAEALPMNDKGNIRVSYETVLSRDAALKRLEIIRKEYNEAAWLLRKK